MENHPRQVCEEQSKYNLAHVTTGESFNKYPTNASLLPVGSSFYMYRWSSQLKCTFSKPVSNINILGRSLPGRLDLHVLSAQLLQYLDYYCDAIIRDT